MALSRVSKGSKGREDLNYGQGPAGRKDPNAGYTSAGSPYKNDYGRTIPVDSSGMPRFTPSPEFNPDYFVKSDPAKDAAWQQQHEAGTARSADVYQKFLAAHPEMQQELTDAAKTRHAATYFAAMSKVKRAIDQENWHNRGLRAPSEATAEERRDSPRPTSALGASHGPGRPDFTGGGGGAGGGAPAPARTMGSGAGAGGIEGYQGGGASGALSRLGGFFNDIPRGGAPDMTGMGVSDMPAQMDPMASQLGNFAQILKQAKPAVPAAGGGDENLSPDIKRKLAMGMSRKLLGLK